MPGVIDTPMTTDTVIEDMDLGTMPSFFKMPVRWVTWAVLAAAAFGLAEVDVPPGAAIGEKIASLFPGVTDAVLSMGARMMKAAGRRKPNEPKSAGEKGSHQSANHKKAG